MRADVLSDVEAARVIGVVVAAGRGSRMGRLTDDHPKCLLPVAGRPLIDHTLERLRGAGCARVVVVTGYRHAELSAHLAPMADVSCVHNPGASEVNVLHSLMCARDALAGAAIVTYADTLFSSSVFEALLATPGDVVVGVDVDWRAAYDGRAAHPVSEAEKVYVDDLGRAAYFGKHLAPDATSHTVGEFVGAARLSARGARTLRDTFVAVDAATPPDAPFRSAACWRQAYLTDLLQECAERGAVIHAATVRRGWLELDTPEDYARLPRIASRQALDLAPTYAAPT